MDNQNNNHECEILDLDINELTLECLVTGKILTMKPQNIYKVLDNICPGKHYTIQETY